MGRNQFLTKSQKLFILSIRMKTDTQGMDAGVAHKITVLESSIRNFVDGLTHSSNHYEITSQKHNDHGFAMLAEMVKERGTYDKEI